MSRRYSVNAFIHWQRLSFLAFQRLCSSSAKHENKTVDRATALGQDVAAFQNKHTHTHTSKF
eukprot:29601-Amphidinium_carterae.2